jgi:hypothetical protein
MCKTMENNGSAGKTWDRAANEERRTRNHNVALLTGIRIESSNASGMQQNDGESSVVDGASELAALGHSMQYAERVKEKMQGHCQLPAEYAEGQGSSSLTAPEVAAEQLDKYIEDQPLLKKKAGKQTGGDAYCILQELLLSV